MKTSEESPKPDAESQSGAKWYHGVTRYQWIVLAIASAGWVFDVYEGQIFNLTRSQLLSDILGVPPGDPSIREFGDIFLGIFLVGGTLGGLFFGSLADRWGRRPVLMLTILFYSIFSGLTYFAQTIEQVAVLRFLVAMGVGGEWAVAAALVAEVFPTKARAHAAGIFHSTSVLGTWLAALAALAVGSEWRFAYLVGVLPALLIFWVRAKVKEPKRWQDANAKAAVEPSARKGDFRELLLQRPWAGRAFLGMLLAAVGLGTFWGVTVAGQDLAREMLLSEGVSHEDAAERSKFAYGIIQTIGGGLGLLSFGPIAARIGRKRAFVLFHLCAAVIVPLTCFGPSTYNQLVLLLPVFGFFTLGMHAGYAIYFPELFPDRLRATGTGFCFNGGRILAASMLIYSGKLKAMPGMDLNVAVTLLGLVFLLGLIVIIFLPETKGKPLPD